MYHGPSSVHSSGETLPRASNLILIVLAIQMQGSLHAQSAPSADGVPKGGVEVPFVGCKSDGQQGPLEAPAGKSRIVSITHEAVSQVAYYKSEEGPGVLAPRGWYCFGTYGSNGSSLFVSPEPISSAELLSDNWKGFSGPAIQISCASGDTSGRFAVAHTIARVFPAHKAFADRVHAEEADLGVDNSLHFGPYPTDRLTYKTKDVVEFQTPANKNGLGTESSKLRKNSDPINGVAMLTGETPDLLFLAVRLPANLSSLSSAIIQQVEREFEAGN
jgi:hypothetical protein